MPRAIEQAGESSPTISYELTPADTFTVLGLSIIHDLTGSASDGYIVGRWLAPDGSLIGWQKIGCGNAAGTSNPVAVADGAPDVIQENTQGNLGVTQPLLLLPLIPGCTVELQALKLADDTLDGSAVLRELTLWVADDDTADNTDTDVVPPYTSLAYATEAG